MFHWWIRIYQPNCVRFILFVEYVLNIILHYCIKKCVEWGGFTTYLLITYPKVVSR